ncbi:MAG TPA: ABC transporter ATP-binding protein [Candidatus Saccharimonadales bacterium]|nr:ABC transporter ATP-binding protein [Candidatus Saccharimonadales bacterium]
MSNPNPQRASAAATNLAVRHYARQIWRHRKYLLSAIVLVALGNVFTSYLPPLAVAALIRHFPHTVPSLHQLAPYLLLFGGAWFLGEMLWRATFLLLSRGEFRAINDLYVDGLAELQKKDIGFFHNNFAGSLTKKTLAYGKNFENFFDTLNFNVGANVLPLLFVGFVLWRFSPWLVAALLGMLVGAGAIIMPLIRKRRRLVAIREDSSNVMAGHVADVIGNMDAVQAFAHHEYEQKQHVHNVRTYMDLALKSWDYHTLRVDMSISPLYVGANVLGLALAVLLGHSANQVATIFVTFSYFASATRILWEFNQTYRNLENAIAEAAQFTELLLAPPAIQEVPNAKRLHVTKGEVDFRGVDFSYKSGRPLFQGLNLHIRPGEKIALVGHSGGGKSTITKLLLRFVDIQNGELLVDGQNIAAVRITDLRQAIAYVPQEPVMFHRTIRENIRYGRLDASDKDVIEAAKKANAHEFISKLPEGYDTLVGERGVKLSGGQRQRVAIARAIIKNAPILVLDEATSALDSESEKLIQTALRELMEKRTAIVIAHRLSTIQKMDRIIVLENGAITEQGTHDELRAHNGTYAKLWAHQSGGFIEE